MTQRERFLRTLRYEATDRRPLYPDMAKCFQPALSPREYPPPTSRRGRYSDSATSAGTIALCSLIDSGLLPEAK
jgi:hypothetical protein